MSDLSDVFDQAFKTWDHFKDLLRERIGSGFGVGGRLNSHEGSFQIFIGRKTRDGYELGHVEERRPDLDEEALLVYIADRVAAAYHSKDIKWEPMPKGHAIRTDEDEDE